MQKKIETSPASIKVPIIMMGVVLLLLLLFYFNPFQSSQSRTEDYLKKIRNNTALLRMFFWQMPKGGDLHHHYSGAVYAETYLKTAINNDYYINRSSLKVLAPSDDTTGNKFSASRKNLPFAGDTQWLRFSTLAAAGLLDTYKEKLMRKWCVKDYDGVSDPSQKLFFETFGNFEEAIKPSLDEGLIELKKRAKAEHVDYIETMFQLIPCSVNTSHLARFNDSLRKAQLLRNESQTTALLESLTIAFKASGVLDCAGAYNTRLQAMHSKLNLDDSTFKIRYQNFALRIRSDVTDVYKDLLVAFASCQNSKLIVGVNIVGQEEDENSMHDYWLHMQMFKYLHHLYPQVKYSIHAGELAPGIVKPEEMTWHISEAVFAAGAQRIGHGVDMPYEKNCLDLMKYMHDSAIAIEINLFSNEFILNIKDDAHPIMLYRKYGVPIIISSDDPGVLRSDLSEQYVLLARRYPEITYAEIKKYVYNSIDYSFLEPGMKLELKRNLDKEFADFENMVQHNPGQ